MRSTTLPVLLLGLTLTGCMGAEGASSQRLNAAEAPEEHDYEGDDECVKIEDEQIGADVVLQVGDIEVAVDGWIEKAGEPDEFRGFTFQATGDVVFRVKAGGELYYGAESPWTNPNGEGGPEVSAVSNVVFCPPEDGDEDGDGGDGGGDDTDDAGDLGGDGGDDGGDVIVIE
jgi:hypothetical protein